MHVTTLHDCDAAGGCHLVTGGTSGLGLLTGRWLAQLGAQDLWLLSRSGLLSQDTAAREQWRALQATDTAAIVAKGDASEPTDMRRYFASAFAGAWHAAGVLADGILSNLIADAFVRVYAPKAHGAFALRRGSVSVSYTHLTLPTIPLV